MRDIRGLQDSRIGLEEELLSLIRCFLWLEPSEQHFPELSQRHAVFVGAKASTSNFETFRRVPTRSDSPDTAKLAFLLNQLA